MDCAPLAGPAELCKLREDPPAAFVIDLSRMPSQGRDLSVFLRQIKATRYVPLVFVGGDPEKVERIRELLPDAVYTDWSRVGRVLEQVIARSVTDPVVPGSSFAAYADTPLPKKLGIKPNVDVVLVDAPERFEETLGDLPEGVTLRRQDSEPRDLALWFVRSREDLVRGIGRMVARAEKGGLWIVWPKKGSPVDSDLSQNVVRQVGLAAGLVDFKVCAVDATWSGLRFTRRPSP